MSTARRKPPPVSDELRAALAGLALQGLFANPDVTGRLLANVDDGLDDFTATCARMAVGAADILLHEMKNH